MRIVSGEHRGMKLNSVPGKNTRPTSDKVKESIFNMIGPYFSGGHCLDLFAGSGNLGLEAISRGVDSAVFVDKNALAIKTINENIKKLRVENKARVYRNDAFKGLKQLIEQNFIFNIIFMDPPYHFKAIHKYLDKIIHNNLLEEEGLIIYEHDSIVKAPSHESLLKIREAHYGTTSITIYKKS